MMNMEQEIAKRINEALEIEVEVKHVSITKNNGIVYDGFTVRKDDERVAPTIYYDKDDSDYEIVERVVNCYININNTNTGEDTNSISETLNNLFNDKDVFYANVIPCIVNNDNVERFDRENIIHDSFLDMEIIYRVRISINNDSDGTIILKQGLVDAYDIDMNLVRENAMKNLRNNLKIDSMLNTLIDLGEVAEKDVSELAEQEGYSMYLITTQDMRYGASAIMLEDVLKDMHDKYGTDEIYILPSSIHEIIVLPKDNEDEESEKENTRAYKSMVMTINATEVNPEDKLTDSVYIHRADGLMTIV